MTDKFPGFEFLSADDRRIVFSYNGVVNEVDIHDFEVACVQKGFDQEIALLRVIIKNIVAKYTADFKTLIRAVEVLTLLLQVRHQIRDDSEDVKNAVRNVIRDVAIPIFGRSGPEYDEAAPLIRPSGT